jgi:hypothetical protein
MSVSSGFRCRQQTAVTSRSDAPAARFLTGTSSKSFPQQQIGKRAKRFQAWEPAEPSQPYGKNCRNCGPRLRITVTSRVSAITVSILSSDSIRKIEIFSQVSGKAGSISGRTPEVGVQDLDIQVEGFVDPEPARGWHT